MRKKFISAVGVCLIMLLSIMSSCKVKDVTFGDGSIDPSAEVSMGLALPVGSITANIGDFLGDSAIANYIQVREDGVLYFQDTFNISREFHRFDLANYVSNANASLKLSEIGFPVGTPIIGDGTTNLSFHFPIELSLNNINQVFDNERIDKISVKDATFDSYISLTDLNLTWDEINSVTLELGSAFERAAGNSIDIPITGYGFEQHIPVTIDEFMLNLMLDKNGQPANSNVVNKLTFEIIIDVTPSLGKNISVTNNTGFDYTFELQFIDYYAAWGMFTAGSNMRDEDTIDLAEEWDGWNTIKGLQLHLAEPEIKMIVSHKIAVPLIMYGDYIFSADYDGHVEYALFNGNHSTTWAMENTIPVDAPFDQACENVKIFDHQESNGQINNLFRIRPDMLGYKFHVEPNYTIQKQARIAKDLDINIDAVTTIPFIFDPGVEFSYSDTIQDLDISSISLDSLLADVAVVDTINTASVKLIIEAENWIPFDVDASFKFYDESMNEIQLNMAENNTLHIAGPNKVENQVVIEPGVSRLIISIDKDNFEHLKQVTNIIYEAALGKNTATVRLLDTSRITLKVGLAAQVDATMNLDFNSEKGGNQ